MKPSTLYEVDETAWLEEMSRLVKERRFDQLDTENLSEYLHDMAIRDRREVTNRLTTLLAHLLKWDYQPKKRTKSWTKTIRVQRQELEGLLESKTLRAHAEEVLPKVYAKAVKRAADETELAASEFPKDCPYTLDEILADD
jgi:hypothetical protein